MLTHATPSGRRPSTLDWLDVACPSVSGVTRHGAVRALAGWMLLLGLLAWVASPKQSFAADLFAELRTFPGVVLLPTETLAPFDGLEPWRVELNRPLPSSVAPAHGRYLVQYRERGTAGSDGTGSAQISGTIGGDEFDDTLSTLSYKRCAADAAYCAENVGGQDGTPPASEVFRGLVVGSAPAVAEHVVCCGGHFWSLTWYDSGRDMTYGLVLVGSIADRYGETITPSNASAAQVIVGVAGQLTPLE